MRKTHSSSVPAPTRRQARRRPLALTGLRGFESAGRQLSFTLAAAELDLTQSSISRQVAALERQLGRPLFVRKTRALQLTPAGERLLAVVRQNLAALDRVVGELRGTGGPPRVTVATYASFASLWLVPRLGAFQREHPEIEIRIDASDRFVDLAADGVDIALRWCRPNSAPTEGQHLLDEEVTPALAPALLERSGLRLAEPRDLLRLPLLELDDVHQTAIASNWNHWFARAGITDAAPAGRLLFTFVDQTLQAAVRGQGVALGRTPFVDELVASGTLITPFPSLRMTTGSSYYLVESPITREQPAVRAFRDWVLTELRRGPQRLTPFPEQGSQAAVAAASPRFARTPLASRPSWNGAVKSSG